MKKHGKKILALMLLVLGTSAIAMGNGSFKKITADRAKQIALARIPGATKENIKKFDSDKDSYEGTVYFNGTEYEFEIDAFTGRVIEWDVEKK